VATRRTASARVLPAVCALLASIALSAALATHAEAAPQSGALSQLSGAFDCVGETTETSEGNTCGTLVTTGTHNAFQVQLSPEGKNAYSVAVDGDLIEYARDEASGALSVIGCITAGTDRCAPGHVTENVAELTNPTAIALSPDGKNAYVTAIGKDAVLEFERNQETGLLTPMNEGKACVTEEATGECEFDGAKGLHEPYGVTVSPGAGENVYVTAVKGEAVAEFARNASTGILEPLAAGSECIGGPTSTCPVASVKGMFEPLSVVVSPDGKNVYVAAGAEGAQGAVVAFEREAGGALKQLPEPEGCISEKIAGCEVATALQGSEDLAISPDERNVYATSAHDNAIVELERVGPNGALEQLAEPHGCLASGPIGGCGEATSIGDSRGVAVSPEGDDVYIGSAGENGVAAFARNAEGALEQLPGSAACVTSNASGCEASNKLLGLTEARRVAVSPDGTNVYVAGQKAGAIVELARAVTPTVTGIGPKSGSEDGGTEVTIGGTGFVEGATVTFGSSAASNVRVNSGTSITATAPPGSATAEVSVSTPMGTSAKSSADRFYYAHLSEPPHELGGLALAQYCRSVGDEEQVTLSKGEVEGPNYAYGNWACVPSHGADVPIAETGPAPSMENACHSQHGESAYAYPENPDNAFSWNCYEDPTVTKVEPQEGPAAGGTAVTITGTNFAASSTVAFGSSDATHVRFNSATSLTATAPQGTGTVDVRVSTFDGASAASVADRFTYTSPSSPLTAKISSLAPIASVAVVVAPPKLAVSGNLAPVSGRVLVKLPGSSTFVALESLEQVPFGTVIDATHGKVTVTTVGPHGALQTMTFFEGEFKLTQARNGMVTATLTGGNFSVCPTARERSHIARASASGASHASGKHVVRKLWAEGHGSYTTKGNYAAGAVLGTRWLTEDLCDGTLIHVATDSVAVTNLVNHRHATVKAGHSYLAKAP
jgi:hypothetical protein